AFGDADTRPEVVIVLDRADVRKCLLHVADLHRTGIEQCPSPGLLFKKFDNTHQILAATVPDIVDGMGAGAPAGLYRAVIRRRTVQAGDNPPNDVVDIGEI